ncbi:MAG: hypothetical protein DRO67_06020 [Candidatus Asgardarchaeum californiense]|nr:MAG: hypothetical protein DRO67_06020 [Candidatus Asgardarchaeum californiense]
MLVDKVARKLNIDPDKLMRESLLRWFEEELAEIKAEIAEIMIKYNIKSTKELEEKKKKGKIPEHPTWEDLIVLEELMETKRRLEEGLAIVKKS